MDERADCVLGTFPYVISKPGTQLCPQEIPPCLIAEEPEAGRGLATTTPSPGRGGAET